MIIRKKRELQHTLISTGKKSTKQCAKCKVFKKPFYIIEEKKVVTGYCWSLADEKPFATIFDCKPLTSAE